MAQMMLGSGVLVSIGYRSFSAVPVCAIASGAVFFLIPAIINGFPFVFPDSADYLVFTPHIYRSPFYGLFIFFFHLDRFIWGPVLVQALIASHLVWVFVRIYAGEPRLGWFALIVLTLGLLTSLPFFTGFIMPDFFTAVMVLAFYLLGFRRAELGRGEQIYLVLLACVAICVHISHLPQAIALAFLVLFLRMLLGTSPRSTLRQAAILVVPIALAAGATLLNNVVIHGVFGLFPAGQTFVLANMIEQGPARNYLKEVCPTAGFKLCAAKDTLPATSYEILWSTDTLQRLGGFEGMRDEANEIIAGTIRTRPSEVMDAVARSVAASFMVHAPGAELFPLSNDPWMADVLAKKFGLETLRSYKDSLAARNLVPREFLSELDDVTFPAAVLALLAVGLLAFRRGFVDALSLGLFVLAAIVINNVLCALG
ncbi:MAG: hypothetical protein JO211_13370, partial [Acidobacteriaceae bacterium]|nr:hypothetical protein [Acidobacteriaceae bacterium]